MLNPLRYSQRRERDLRYTVLMYTFRKVPGKVFLFFPTLGLTKDELVGSRDSPVNPAPLDRVSTDRESRPVWISRKISIPG